MLLRSNWIPTDVMLSVVQQLHIRDRTRCRRVCRYLNELVRKHPPLPPPPPHACWQLTVPKCMAYYYRLRFEWFHSSISIFALTEDIERAFRVVKRWRHQQRRDKRCMTCMGDTLWCRCPVEFIAHVIWETSSIAHFDDHFDD